MTDDVYKTQAEKFLKENPSIAEWFDEEMDKGNNFVESVYDSLFTFGHLTDRQLEVIEERIAEKE